MSRVIKNEIIVGQNNVTIPDNTCLHALVEGNQHIWIREKTLEFFSTVLSTLYLDHKKQNKNTQISTHEM